MKARTCPHCGYQYSRIEYVKKLFLKFLWSDWECTNCGHRITFDENRRWIVAVSFGVWTFMLNMGLFYRIGFNYWPLTVAVYFVGTIFIFSFDTFKKSKRLG